MPAPDNSPLGSLRVGRPRPQSFGSAIADDFQIVDDLEPVTLTSFRGPTSANGAASMIDLVTKAERRGLSSREKAPSAGAYQETGVSWWLPVRLLSDAIQPLKPRDTVLDRSGNLWTAQSAELIVQGSWWKLACLNLSIVWDLQDLIDIQKPLITFDASGAKLKAWDEGSGAKILYRQLPARVQLLSQDLVTERGIEGLKGTHEVYVSQQLLTDSSWHENRIKWTDQGVVKYLEILRYRNPLRIDELPILEAELAP